jgi:hypothetical protein
LRDALKKMRNIKNYNDVFDSKNAFILLNYKKKNHSINLLSSKESFYELLYSFFKKELDILQEYLLKNLALNKIRKFISLINASMLFVLKSDNNLRLCVNYRNLNVIIIKNRCSLSLIKKTLNRLIDVVYFTKLNLKNAYY